MADPNKLVDEYRLSADGDEDEETLAAIDEGMRDAEAGRLVPSEEVRRFLSRWAGIRDKR